MSKEVLLSLVRTILTAIGAFFVGKTIFGTEVNSEVWQGWLGGALALVSTVWGIVSKDATVESVQSGLRSFIVVAGGILIALGKLKSETLEAILGVIAAIIPFLYSTLSKQKTAQLANGTLNATLDGQVKKAA